MLQLRPDAAKKKIRKINRKEGREEETELHLANINLYEPPQLTCIITISVYSPYAAPKPPRLLLPGRIQSKQ